MRVEYVTSPNSYDYTKISPYPFEFTVVETEDDLQRAIKDNPSAPVINIYLPQITISVFTLGSIAVVIFLYRKRTRG